MDFQGWLETEAEQKALESVSPDLRGLRTSMQVSFEVGRGLRVGDAAEAVDALLVFMVEPEPVLEAAYQSIQAAHRAGSVAKAVHLLTTGWDAITFAIDVLLLTPFVVMCPNLTSEIDGVQADVKAMALGWQETALGQEALKLFIAGNTEQAIEKTWEGVLDSFSITLPVCDETRVLLESIEQTRKNRNSKIQELVLR